MQKGSRFGCDSRDSGWSPMMASEDDRVETQGTDMVQIPQSRVANCAC
jgi:hypothetical protein